MRARGKEGAVVGSDQCVLKKLEIDIRITRGALPICGHCYPTVAAAIGGGVQKNVVDVGFAVGFAYSPRPIGWIRPLESA